MFGFLYEAQLNLSHSSSLAQVIVGPGLRRRETVADQIAVSLRDAIRTGLLKDGEHLNQVGIAQHFGVSRVPVREAMRQLEAEGWIAAPANQRAFVQALSYRQVEQIFDLRELLEGDLIAKSVRKTTPAQLMALRRMCSDMAEVREHTTWVAANRAFHRALLAPTDASFILDLVDGLSVQVERYLRLRGSGPERQREAGAEHDMILDAVSAKRGKEARNLLVNHIRKTRLLVLAGLDEARPITQPKTLRMEKQNGPPLQTK